MDEESGRELFLSRHLHVGIPPRTDFQALADPTELIGVGAGRIRGTGGRADDALRHLGDHGPVGEERRRRILASGLVGRNHLSDFTIAEGLGRAIDAEYKGRVE